MIFDELEEFAKEFKRLAKKYKTLGDDLEKLKKVLIVTPKGIGKNFAIIHATSSIKIIKARMACRALCNHSLRIIYAYCECNTKIEFIELYFKGDKENENYERIKEYLKNYSQLWDNSTHSDLF